MARTLRTGFIGLGDQGGPMAEMILAAGLPLRVWTRRPEAAEPFVRLGAGTAATPAELAHACDLLCLCVPDDADVEQVLHGAGALAALAAGAVLSVHSTVSVELCVRLAAEGAARGVEVLDAPVSGSGRAARARSLAMMVGGDASALERAKPVFETYAAPIVHMGGSGAGMRAKLVNNLMAAAQIGLAARAFTSARASGLDPDAVRQAVLAGTGRSFGAEALVRLQAPGRAAHVGRLLRKDVALARAGLEGVELGPLFGLANDAVAALDGWAQGASALLSSEGGAAKGQKM